MKVFMNPTESQEHKCGICSDFKPHKHEQMESLLKCRHLFHSSCIKNWLDTMANYNFVPCCPYCKINLREKKEGETSFIQEKTDMPEFIQRIFDQMTPEQIRVVEAIGRMTPEERRHLGL